MSEPGAQDVNQPTGASPSAGTLLRTARQAQGLHIAALAASIKVSQRKLELLEADRLAELPDATFARALAQTICRSLKIDPAPVLAALPQAPGYRLDAVDAGINTPFRDRPGRHEPAPFLALTSPGVWVTALIAGAALLVLLMPADWVSSIQTAISSPPASTAASAAPLVAATESPPLAAAPVDVAAVPTDAASAAIGDVAASTVVFELPASSAASALPLTATAAVGPLQLKASAETWVEVVDGESRVLVSRMLASGEALALNGASPFKLKIGNAAGTSVAFRGQVVDLASSTRDNVARLELK
jgi:cytoskeleton protein RodZ